MQIKSFKDYYKFPLVYKENFPYVLANDGRMALTWLVDSNDIEQPEEIINKMNGYSNKKYDQEWSLRETNFIYYGDKKMFLLRGWGMLTGVGLCAYHLPTSDAFKIQQHFGNYLVENLNK